MFYQNVAKIRDVKNVENQSITAKNYAVTYYQALEGARWHVGLKNSKDDKNFKKLKKIVKFGINLRAIFGVT